MWVCIVLVVQGSDGRLDGKIRDLLDVCWVLGLFRDGDFGVLGVTCRTRDW